MQHLLLTIVCCLLVSSCCAQRSTFVLLPDPDGKVGKITVTNDRGERTLDQARQSVVVPSKTGRPGHVEVMDETKIRDLFGRALDIQPLPPAKFLLYFKFDSTVLQLKSYHKMTILLEAARDRNSLDISVNGHTDRTGNAEYNYKLSHHRARHIQGLLVHQGIDPQIISTTSHGEGNPLVPTSDNVAEPRNRRVEVIIR